jgi:AcrR family transcriptional regulator
MTIERDTSVTSARTKRGAASRARLRAAAQTSFAAYGYTGTRISDIVALAGMSQGAFYRHFPDKNSVLMEALRDPIDLLLSRTGGGPDDTSAELPALIERNTQFFATYTRHREILRVLREAASLRESGFLELWLGTRARFVTRIEEWLRNLQQDGVLDMADLPLAAEAFAATLEQLAYVHIGLAAAPPRPERIAELGRTTGELWHRMLHAPPAGN